MKRLYITIVCLLSSLSLIEAVNDKEWRYIGMPIGGICTGQVYLGGDGQLWNWDIFNVSTTDPGGAGDLYYLNPMHQQNKFVNGFGITVHEEAKVYSRVLNASGFSDITFEGEYPIGKVKYRDVQVPVEVNLTAFSPFIPTDADNSGLPLIQLEYSVKNISDEPLKVELNGWLQNMSCFQTCGEDIGFHENIVTHTDNFVGVSFSSDKKLSDKHADWGTMTLAALDSKAKASANCNEIRGTGFYYVDSNQKKSQVSLGKPLIGGVQSVCELKRGESHTFKFVVAWCFPNIHLWNGAHNWRNKTNLRYYYSKSFPTSDKVVDYIVKNPQLVSLTKLWNETWYDATLPEKFLDRTFVNVSTLATTASVRFDDLTDDKNNEGRYYNYEGVYLGEGTCRHVSHYGQVLGRVFPDLARKHREQIDLGLSLSKDGIIGYRGEFSGMGRHDGRGYAADGQAGTILGVYREYLMSPNDDFLKRNWINIKKAMQYMISQDKEKTGKADGILEGIQYNTLDRMWFGKIPWISGLYVAALRASAKMAEAVGDRSFAKECNRIAERGYKNIPSELFNGEYFIQKLDPEHLDAPNVNNGCHIDQLLGQYWAYQLGLGNIFPEETIESSLRSILKYNYVENYDKYLSNTEIPIARWYADGDEKGLIMCSFPHGGADKAPGKINNDWEKLVVGYFSEMWTGQEHAVIATLLNQNMVKEAMKLEDAICDRYDARKRNPYNEIEYGNHYTRAMSGFAPFISATGFYYNGPEGIIGFDPKMNADNFKSAFITAQGWGSYSQKKCAENETFTVDLKYGSLQLKKMIIPTNMKKINHVVAKIGDREVKVKVQSKDVCIVSFDSEILQAGDLFSIQLFAN